MKTKINHIQNLLKCFYAWKILMKPFYTLYCHWNFFFFKCLLLYFTFSFHAAKISILYYQRNILELIKLKKPMPVQTVFSLSKYCLQIGLQWLLISWFHYKILACLDKIMPVVHPFQQHILSHCSSNGNQISCLCSGKILYSWIGSSFHCLSLWLDI